MSQVAWTTCLACRWVIWKLHKFNKSLAAWLFNTLPKKPTYSSYSITPRLHLPGGISSQRSKSLSGLLVAHATAHMAENIGGTDWRQLTKPSAESFLVCFVCPFFHLFPMSICSLSLTKPFPSHGLTLLVYNCLSRPKDLAMCNVQSKAEMGMHALHAPQRICKACKEKKYELEKMQGQHFKRIRCEGKKMWKKVSQRNSLTQLYQCKGITHLNRCNRCSNCFNSSMLWVRKAIYTKHLREEGVRFVACIEVNSNPSLLLSWF